MLDDRSVKDTLKGTNHLYGACNPSYPCIKPFVGGITPLISRGPPCRERSHIPPLEKEHHRLKSVSGRDMLVPRRVHTWRIIPVSK